jgi:phosphoribosylaminoimidazolecarboxamide formyltransferase/IMP cyclohydrolase
MPGIRRALISVSDKRGIVEFARALRSMGVELISTGGTHAALTQAGIPVTSVSGITGVPEILGGRVKTLHPKIHGGLLGVTDDPVHAAQMSEHGIAPIDLLVVNLYPFEQTVAREDVALAEAVEQIDVGGPAMIRAAAKNYRYKTVIVNPDRYPGVLKEMREGSGSVSESTRFALAREVFRHTAAYDTAIASYLDRTAGESGPFPDVLGVSLRKELELRYGENPHQRGALYGSFGSLFARLHGKELSYNNIVDIAAAALLVAEFDEPSAAIVKHTNPCGVGSGRTLTEAYERALATDATSAFGGIIAVNRPLDLSAAERMNAIFTEVIIAPAFEEGVLAVLTKKKDRRIIQVTGDLRRLRGLDLRSVPGGMLVQDADCSVENPGALKVVTRRSPTADELRAMHFAWRVARHVKSNAIVYATTDRTIGIGAGQMSRVDSAKLAAIKAATAGLSVRGTAVASDAFFPFADGLLEAVHAGSTAVIQPGGSMRDDEVIRAADDNNLAMVFTGIRHFKH